MALNIPDPEFLQFAALQERQPSPFLTGLESAVKGAEAVQQIQSGAQALKGQQLQQQLLQSQIQDLPIAHQMLLHQAAAQNLNLNQSQHLYANTRLADLGDLPANQKADAYKKVRNELVGLGVPQDSLPATYGPNTEQMIQTAVQQSPVAKDQRQFLQQATLQQMQNIGKIQAAQIGVQAKMQLAQTAATGQVPYQKAAAQAFVKEQQNASDKAKAAQDLIENVNTFVAKALQLPLPTGPAIGRLEETFTPEGQAAKKAYNQMIMSLLRTVHVGGQIRVKELQILQNQVPSFSMYKSASIPIANMYKAVAQRTMQYEDFLNAAQQMGLNLFQTKRIWNKYLEENPLFDPNTLKPYQENIANWHKYLTPTTIQQIIGNPVQIPAGFKDVPIPGVQ